MASFSKSNRGKPEVALEDVHYKMLVSVRQSVDRIKRSSTGLSDLAREHHLNGVFLSLTTPSTMRQLLYPGTPADVMSALPQNLRDVLRWDELQLDLVAIAKNAADVLEGIKKKGAKAGDYMDDNTERVLLPQIAQEALARGVIDAVRKLNVKISSTIAKNVIEVASPESEKAQRDQLDGEVCTSLHSDHFASQEEYMGTDWAGATRADLARFLRDESMSLVNERGEVLLPDQVSRQTEGAVPSRISWIEVDDRLREIYPALSEILDQLRALPYELNAKCQFQDLDLLEPMRGCTLLAYYPAHAKLKTRLDCRSEAGGSALDSGIRVTCCYHLRHDAAQVVEVAAEDTARAQLVFEVDGRPGGTQIPLQDDLLTLHKSAVVKNARTPDSQCGWFAIYLFIHGRSKPAKAT